MFDKMAVNIVVSISGGKTVSTSRSERTRKIQMLKRRMMTLRSLTMTLRWRISVRMRRTLRRGSKVRSPRRRGAQGRVKIRRENAEQGKRTRELSIMHFLFLVSQKNISCTIFDDDIFSR